MCPNLFSVCLSCISSVDQFCLFPPYQKMMVMLCHCNFVVVINQFSWKSIFLPSPTPSSAISTRPDLCLLVCIWRRQKSIGEIKRKILLEISYPTRATEKIPNCSPFLLLSSMFFLSVWMLCVCVYDVYDNIEINK